VTDDSKEPRRPKRRANGKGTIFRVGAQWYGKWSALIDGVLVRVTRKLGTTNELVARRLVDECAALKCDLHEHPARSQQASKRTSKAADGPAFEQAAEQVLSASKVANHAALLEVLRLHAFEHLGMTPVRAITSEDVEAVLIHARDAKGLARLSIKNLKQAISAALAPFYPDAPVSVTGNGRKVRVTPATVAAIPAFERSTRKERARLTDDEIAIYLQWVHPLKYRQHAVRERQTMAVLSRCFGGVRAGDVHAMRWETLDTQDGAFSWGWAPRRKTGKPQRLIIPQVLRPVLHAWWTIHGQPTEGPLFPTLRGDNAGQGQKGKVSHAKALRRDLEAAMKWAAKAKLPGACKEGSPRWRELFTETHHTLPVDFHSFRRAFADGLRRSGVNEQTAKAFGGWASNAMDRYHGTEDVAVPDAAVPRLVPVVSALDSREVREEQATSAKCSESLARPEGFEPPTFGSVDQTTSCLRSTYAPIEMKNFVLSA
jgi:integrase